MPYFIGTIFINWRKILKYDIRLFYSLKLSCLDGYSIAFYKPLFTYYIIQFSKVGFHWLRFTKLVNRLKETPITWTNQPIKLKEKVNLISRARCWVRVSRAQRWLHVSRVHRWVRVSRAQRWVRFPALSANCVFSSGASYISTRAYPWW